MAGSPPAPNANDKPLPFGSPCALQPTPERNRSYSQVAAKNCEGEVVSSHAPKGVPGGTDLFKPTRAVLRSFTLGEYLDARLQARQERDAHELSGSLSDSTLSQKDKSSQKNAFTTACALLNLTNTDQNSDESVVTLDVQTLTGSALRTLAKVNTHSAPVVDKQNRDFLGFVDTNDLLTGFFSCLTKEVVPPKMPVNPTAAAQHAFQRLGIADEMASLTADDLSTFVRDDGNRRWIASVDRNSLTVACDSFLALSLSELRDKAPGTEDGRMIYRGAVDKKLLEIVRGGFLGTVVAPSVRGKKEDAVATGKENALGTVADFPPRASTCHRVATYKLRIDSEWRSDAMLVDEIVSQWDIVEFLSEEIDKGNEALGVFGKTLRLLGMAGTKSLFSDSDNADAGTSTRRHRTRPHMTPITVMTTDTVLSAFARLRFAGVSCVGVVNEPLGPVVGILTASDFQCAFIGPGAIARTPEWIARELLCTVDLFLYRVRMVRLFWERNTFEIRDGHHVREGESTSPMLTPALTFLRTVTPDNTLADVVRLMSHDKTHHVLVVSAGGLLRRVITPADVLRAIAAPSGSTVGWQYKETSSGKESTGKKSFEDGVRTGVVSNIGPGDVSQTQMGFAGRFDDEM